MNRRIRQMERAMTQQKYRPILAMLHMDGALPKLVFIDPRDWEECKKLYGSALEVMLWSAVEVTR